jgi:hypothetical protein
MEVKDDDTFTIGSLDVKSVPLPLLCDPLSLMVQATDWEVLFERCIHTPCHTQDSICYFITDKASGEQVVLTGDTLFTGSSLSCGLLSVFSTRA